MAVTIAETVEHLKGLALEDASLGTARLAELKRGLPLAAEILRRYGAVQIFVFGSVARGETRVASDLDLATTGLPNAVYFDALSELFRRLPCDVDLVRLEEAPASLRERIRAEGREL